MMDYLTPSNLPVWLGKQLENVKFNIINIGWHEHGMSH
jgi:hypothetical protein